MKPSFPSSSSHLASHPWISLKAEEEVSFLEMCEAAKERARAVRAGQEGGRASGSWGVWEDVGEATTLGLRRVGPLSTL